MLRNVDFISWHCRFHIILASAARRDDEQETSAPEFHRGHPVCGKRGVIFNAFS